MTEKAVVLLDETFPIPIRALNLIQDHSHWWMGRPTIPDPEDVDLHKAHNTVAAWLMALHRQYPCFFDGDKRVYELHPTQAQLGVCPECLTNDGFLIVGDDVSAVCHCHQLRWQVTGGEIGQLAQMHSVALSDEDHVRVSKYSVVKPVWLPGFEPIPEPPKRAAGHLREVETETFTQGMARVWKQYAKIEPTIPHGGRSYRPRFWRPAAELVKAALTAIKKLDDGSGSLDRASV